MQGLLPALRAASAAGLLRSPGALFPKRRPCTPPLCRQVWRASSFAQRRALLKVLLQYIVDHQEEICRWGCVLSSSVDINGVGVARAASAGAAQPPAASVRR